MTHPASRIIEHYERHATAWDCDRQNSAWNDKVWHDLFIDRLAAGAKVLDLGCGSGRPVARHMAERGLLVTGVDSSPTMISLCRSRLPDHAWIVADMRELSLEHDPEKWVTGFPSRQTRSVCAEIMLKQKDKKIERDDDSKKSHPALGRCFQGILAWDSFFHLDHDDQRRMFAVFAAHASGGAWLMFNAGPRHGEAIGNYRGDPLYHASLSPGEYKTLINRFGFEVIEHAADDERAGGRTVWLCRSRSA